MDLWHVLLHILALLATAMVLGAVCERLRQSPLLGYLMAGTILGPNALAVIHRGEVVELLAELGIALLLFSIGLEFSWTRLRRLGRTALLGGLLQVGVTLVLAAAAALTLGVPARAAMTIGAIVALSSTACVLRLLVSRAEIESVHGTHALGVLLVQDAAVVPLVLMASILTGDDGASGIMTTALLKLGGALALIAVLYALFNWIVPTVLHFESVRSNRDLPALLAITAGLGSAWSAHAMGLSPALGAFVAGMLLAASPFSTQIRADVAPIRTLLVTLFFSSIGMLGDPAWFLTNIGPVLALVAAIVVGKAIVIAVILKALGLRLTNALATGICLAQVGEFSFVLAETARGALLDEHTFKLIVSATIATLFLTPYLVGLAPPLSDAIISRFEPRGRRSRSQTSAPAQAPALEDHAIIIGYGPAGQAAARVFNGRDETVVVIDLNPSAMSEARRAGFITNVGDARHADVLEHARIHAAHTVVVTVPDPDSARTVVELIRSIAPNAHVIARARYHRHREDLAGGGAHEVIDEEQLVGLRLAALLRRRLYSRATSDEHPTPPAPVPSDQ